MSPSPAPFHCRTQAFCHLCPPAQTLSVTNGGSVCLPCPQDLTPSPAFLYRTFLPSPITISFSKHMNSLDAHPGKGHVCSLSQAPQSEGGQYSHGSHGYFRGHLKPSFSNLFLILLLLAKIKQQRADLLSHLQLKNERIKHMKQFSRP